MTPIPQSLLAALYDLTRHDDPFAAHPERAIPAVLRALRDRWPAEYAAAVAALADEGGAADGGDA